MQSVASTTSSAYTPHTQKTTSFWQSHFFVALLLLIIVGLGASFRFVATNWDDFVSFHPDERFLTSYVAANLGRNWLSFTDGNEEEQAAYCLEHYPQTNGVGDFFDARCSTFNPHNIGNGHFVYGTLPPFAAYGVGQLLNELSGPESQISWTNADRITLIWRLLSAVYDTLVILIVFATGVQLRGKWVGLIAAALYAGAVLPIQVAHFATADAMTSLWVALTIYFVARAQVKGGWFAFIGAGIAFGAALASRFNIFPLVIAIIAVAVIRVAPAFDKTVPASIRRGLLINNFLKLVIAGFFTLLVFRIFNPYAFEGPGFFGLIPNHRWLDDLLSARTETSSVNDAPPNWQWVSRIPYVFALSNMILWGMGIALGILSWVGLVWSAWRLVRLKAGGMQFAPIVLWIGIYFVWVGGNFVMSMRYYLPLYSGFVVLSAWALTELIQRAWRSRSQLKPILKFASVVLALVAVGFTLLWAGMFTNIYRHMATYVQVGQWTWENLSGDFSMRIDDAPEGEQRINIALSNTWGVRNVTLSNSTHINTGFQVSHEFVAPASGTVTSLFAPRIGAVDPAQTSATLHFTVLDTERFEILTEAFLSDTFIYDTNRVGNPYTIDWNVPLTVTAGERYLFTVQVIEGGAVATTGTVVTWEGSWDEPVPPQVCTLPFGITLADDPPPGLMSIEDCNRRNASATLVTTNQLELYRDDEESKLTEMLNVLNATDYIMIGTNRRYDSQSRFPLRWPLTNHYYQALFSGQLGFDLVETFQESFELGPLQVSDQYLPTYTDTPQWLNEFESEEAFTVYDHPVVFVFQKRTDYDPALVAEILGSVPLTNVYSVQIYNNCPDSPPNIERSEVITCDPTIPGVAVSRTPQVAQASTMLFLPDFMRTVQYDNGTWSARFDLTSAINQNQGLAVAVWWLAIIVIGWVTWPFLFRMFPALADRGYAFSKFVGIFLAGWITWFISSLQIPVWSQTGILGALGVIFLVGLYMLWRARREFIDWLRQHWRRLVLIEIIMILAFGAFLLVRLSNPDLWHDSFGGEKPMDYAYFNAVLRSTVFPPYDPWFVDGYINYYYFGFVIVGVPTLLLKISPSIAYNLIIPMLFSMTAIGAFSVAYSTVHTLHERLPHGTFKRLGKPWLAGIAALMLAVVLGNLDTPRVALTGVANLGDDQRINSLHMFLVHESTEQAGIVPDSMAVDQLRLQAEENRLNDRLRYEIYNVTELFGALGRGFQSMLNGEQVYVSSERWFWAPTRILAEEPVSSGGAIVEMPAFTFIYGDLHAHMISMPLQLFIIAFGLNELLLAGEERRGSRTRWLALGLGAVAVGMLRATNTWDWITYFIFGIAGLAFAWWVRWHKSKHWFSYQSVTNGVMRVGGFIVLSMIAVWPYTHWYTSTYNSVKLWEENRTPLWAYLDIWGLFLFLIVSLLIWDTSRWLRNNQFSGDHPIIDRLINLFLLLVPIGASVILAAMGYQAALVGIPLLIWTVILFMRTGQSRTMQFVLALVILSLGLTLGVEFVVLDGDVGRQNTVFKFYLQAWLMLSIVGGVAFAWLIQSLREWPLLPRLIWVPAMVILVGIAALFPITAIQGKAVYRMPMAEGDEYPLTLDGQDFMLWATRAEGDEDNVMLDPTLVPFPLSEDHAMIRWLQTHVEGTPTIVEGLGPDPRYRWVGRISIYTGLPSILGWKFHQTQQRTLDPLGALVNVRHANVNALYESTHIEEVWDLIQFYHVDYVIVGRLERAYYNAQGLEKFDRMVEMGLLTLVWQEGESRIYQSHLEQSVLEVG